MRDLIDNLRVFRVPLRVTVFADALVLATDASDARVQAIKISDLGTLFDLDESGITTTDECILEFTNHDVPTIEPGEPKPISQEQYSPETHPDFDEDIHCVEEEPRTDDESDHLDDAAREKGPFTS